MNQLLLLRHAKSSWDSASLSDHERPLAPRGLRAVAALREHIEAAGIAPDLVLCSTAQRAVETWESVAPACPSDTPVQWEDELYGATAPELRQRLRQLPSEVSCVLMIGHNPGFEDLAHGLMSPGDTDLHRRIEAKFPTGALATLTIASAWSELDWGAAELTDFVVPRQLDEGLR